MMTRMMPLALIALLAGCGSDETAAGTQILLEDLNGDLPEEDRIRLIGVLVQDPVTIEFPDGEGSVEVVVTSARLAMPLDAEGQFAVPSPESEPTHIRSIAVTVADPAGYEMTASLSGNPVNMGTEDQVRHTRTVIVTRGRESLFGTSGGQMSLRVQPTQVERQ